MSWGDDGAPGAVYEALSRPNFGKLDKLILI
jgi:hypothetical protein